MTYPSPDLYPSEDLFPGGSVPAGVRPTLAELASLLRARTRDKVTGEKGEFTENTNPTRDQAADKLTQAVNETAARWPALPASLYNLARQVTLYRAAVLLERGYFPEAARADEGTAHDDFYADWERYSRELTAVNRRVSPRSNVGSVRLQTRATQYRQSRDAIVDAWSEDAV